MILPPQPSASTENKILAALAALNDAEAQSFFPQLERVSLTQGDVIYEADAQIDYVYFPETAVFSMLCIMQDGNTVEVGPVGDEGMVGLRLFLGAETSPEQVIVHVSGDALRLKAGVLKEELSDGQSAMPEKLIRYTQMLLSMTGRSGSCYKLHTIEQQLARWLLMMNDYVGDELRLTHELISLTLGTRRAGISEAASDFRKAGAIDYQRGHIQIVDRRGLESMACECYGIIRDEYERLYADLAGSSK